MTYQICVVRYGSATVQANSEEEAIAIAERKMTSSDFDWSSIVVDEIKEA